MSFLIPRRNYREKIGCFSIFSNHLIFLILPFLLIMVIIYSGRTIARAADFGGISGYVKRYSDNSPINGVTVTAIDSMNMNRGHTTTNTNGYYKIVFESMPSEPYRVCVRKDGYNPECYQEPGLNGCSGRDCGAYWPAEATKTQGSLITVVPPNIVTGINFRIARGGNIKGHISGALEESPDPNVWTIDYKVFLEGEIEYKNNDSGEFKLELYKDSDNDYFILANSIVIPPGNYTVRAEDHSFLTNQMSLPYYYTVYYNESGGTYIEDNAKILTYTIDQPTLKTADFTIRMGGMITGFVKEDFGNKAGLLNIRVEGKENNLKITKETNTRTIVDSDPNIVKSYNGFFSLTGLSPGSYIIKVDDTPIGIKYGDPNLQIYLPEYYNDVYFEDEATLITISASDIAKPGYQGGPPIEISLKKGPVIKGCVMDRDTSLCSQNQYNPENGLTGITLELKPDFQSFHTQPIREVQTGPNGYIFKEFHKILPGQYKIRAYDKTSIFSSTDYKTITIAEGVEYEVNFCMKKSSGEDKGNISGHLYLEENPDHPLPGFRMLLYNYESPKSHYDYTNNNGEFFFNDIEKGSYILTPIYRSEDPNYGDLIYEIYKDVIVLNIDIWESLFLEATFLNIGDNVDMGLSNYKYTFGSGLNLFAYPGLPVEEYDYTNEFCSELGSALHNFRWKDPGSGQWYVITTSNLHNNPKQLHTGQGYFIYMKNQAGPFFFPPSKTMPPKFYQLKPGKNIIAYPSSLHRPIKRSSDLLNKLGTQEEVASVASFDNTSGKWKSTVWVWNKPGAADFPIVQGEGYVAEMWVSKQVETDEPNI